MRRSILIVLVLLSVSKLANGQTDEAAQLLLNWEKLNQLKEILSNMYTGYRVLENGYATIKNISEGNYTLHQAFLDGLMAVSPAVRNNKRVPLIIKYQKFLLDEYKRAYQRFKADPHFTIDEILYLESVYSFLFRASIRNLEDLAMIVTATKLRMNDDERLQAIDMIYYEIERKVMFLRQFNNSTQLLAVQRAKEKGDEETVKKLYGLAQ
jgi:hypothetical protein